MGLGINDGDDLVGDDGDGSGADRGNGGKFFGSVSCLICFETVADNGDRSWAKLQCGHQFHLGVPPPQHPSQPKKRPRQTQRRADERNVKC
ncbi:hypothetical protein SLEP1_g45741 [Rubroshorea leprosula]|uniref:RING-type domain-containing protein n=1 Tax=Rubroshorea leprosula TaxID=152421 RepID=A0AAV5LLS7_9ROSI|nr:hypothetical protein SLEP1_g45741 [Rubroshorea leprosula]